MLDTSIEQPTYLPTYLPTSYLHPAYLPTYPATDLPIYLPSNLLTSIQTHLSTSPVTYLPVCLPTNIRTYLPTYISTYIPSYPYIHNFIRIVPIVPSWELGINSLIHRSWWVIVVSPVNYPDPDPTLLFLVPIEVRVGMSWSLFRSVSVPTEVCSGPFQYP